MQLFEKKASRRLGTQGEHSQALCRNKPLLPAASAEMGLPTQNTSSRNASPLVPTAVVHVRPCWNWTSRYWSKVPVDTAHAGCCGSAQGPVYLHCSPFHTGSCYTRHYSRRLSAKSVFSTMTNLFLWWLSASQGSLSRGAFHLLTGLSIK